MTDFVRASMRIAASAEWVWHILTAPEMTERYMYGCRVATNWQPGERVDWNGTVDGKTVTYVTGQVLAYEPHTMLSYSAIDPNATYPHTPENHLVITMTLAQDGDDVLLSVSQGDYTKVADAENRLGHNPEEGWMQLLSAIKTIAEQRC
jgi:uncharacterized protein YndB with AHSA1/START domain